MNQNRLLSILGFAYLIIALGPLIFPGPLHAQEQSLSREQLLTDFQNQQIVPEKGRFMITKGDFPALRWEQPLVVREVWGSVLPLKVRWFDAAGNEVEKAEHTGRYAAFVEAQAPDRVTIRRARTFYVFEPAAMMKLLREHQNDDQQTVDPPTPLLSEANGDVIYEAYTEFAKEIVNKHLFADEKGAILFAAAAEVAESDDKPTAMDHPSILHQEHHLAVRRKVMGVEQKYPPLKRPLMRDEPAPVLLEGSPAEAGFDAALPEQLRELCERWVDEAAQPFTLVVARRGVVIFHESFGQHEGENVTRDTAYPMFSITKSMTGLMAAQFFDQGLLQVDQPIGEVLTDFPTEGDYVPTFRDCLMHTSGIEGHGDFGALENPWMDNVITNAWELHEQHYAYSGTAIDLVGFALAIVSGKSAPRLFHDHMFEPLNFENARVKSLGMGGELRAIDLAKLGQLLLNEGSYGNYMFFGPETYQKLLPRQYDELYPHLKIRTPSYGLAIRYAGERHPDAGKGDLPKDATIFSPATLGHGAFSGSIWRVDPENEIVIAMGRFSNGEKHTQYSRQLFMTVMQAVRD